MYSKGEKNLKFLLDLSTISYYILLSTVSFFELYHTTSYSKFAPQKSTQILAKNNRACLLFFYEIKLLLILDKTFCSFLET